MTAFSIRMEERTPAIVFTFKGGMLMNTLLQNMIDDDDDDDDDSGPVAAPLPYAHWPRVEPPGTTLLITHILHG
jgi:hypothetical protein